MPKRKELDSVVKKSNDEEFILNNKIEDEKDLSDSEESVYSGLEDEGSSDSEAEEEKLENESDEPNEGSGDESDSDTEDQDGDDESQSSDEEESENEDVKLTKVTQVDHTENGVLKKSDRKNMVTTIAVFEDVDTSDEEDIRNTVGNIPMEWYDEYQHIGYDLQGKKIGRKLQGDQLDNLLTKLEDPDYWRTVHDKLNCEDIKLSDEEISIIQRIKGGMFPEEGFDPFEPYVTPFTDEEMVLPIKSNPQPKNSFIPSKWEHKKVIKIVRAIRNGWVKPKPTTDGKPKYYLLWGKDDKPNEHPMHWPAPKLKLPGHEESYNPPPEYLPTEEEVAAFEAMDPEDRPQNFLSKKYDSLRKVPGYSNFIQEKFERCLDLYLCPRQRKVRLQVDPEDLIPKLPRPKDLQPYPTTQSLIYSGHEGQITCISVDPSGQWLASGSTDKSIRFWEVSTCKCMKKIDVEGTVHSIQWNPVEELPIVVAAVEKELLVINPELGDKLLSKNIDNQISGFVTEGTDESDLAKWCPVTNDEHKHGLRLRVEHQKAIKQVIWHRKGDYLATVMPDGESKSVIVHQFSKRRSQCPFKKAKGQIQCVCFHPSKPFFFVATQRYVRVYNLQKQELSKKLISGVKWISSMDIHPQGDNIIIGSYDKRLCWFDLDLSTKPYKILRHHKKAVRQVAYHRCYPLFASAADDGSVIVCHGAVYNDLMQNPLIVPLKILKGHKVVNDLGVIDCKFHPHQPWIFTAGADKTIRLFT